jgi:UDP-glucuronate decarboxylase
MRVLVTGGAGFLGSHLCDRLLRDGHEVLCLDNFFTGRRENVMHVLDHPGFELVRHDVTEPILLEVDQIYNLACPASPVHYQYNPVKTVKTNVMGTINMLGLAKRVRARILQASTSEVYGDPEVHPQPEAYWGNVNPVGIRSCYDEGKRLAETLMMDYLRQNNVDTRIVRIFNTYGPRMLENDGRVISNFIVQALRGEELTIYGDGQQTRAFCYVDDLIEGMVRLMNLAEDTHPSFSVHDPVNIGSDEEFTMSELAAEIGRAVGAHIRTRHCPLPADDPRQRRPDLSRAKQLLGWSPSTSFQEGIRKTVEYFARRQNAGSPPLAHSARPD